MRVRSLNQMRQKLANLYAAITIKEILLLLAAIAIYHYYQTRRNFELELRRIEYAIWYAPAVAKTVGDREAEEAILHRIYSTPSDKSR